MSTGTVEILSEYECLRLLASADLGRFVVVVDNYPLVFPVNYVLDRDVVTFRTAPGTKLDSSLHSNVAFEVDYVDADRRNAWSVVVSGTVDRLGMTEQERDHVTHLAVRPMAPGDKPAWVRIVSERITGRRLRSDDESFAFDPRGYL